MIAIIMTIGSVLGLIVSYSILKKLKENKQCKIIAIILIIISNLLIGICAGFNIFLFVYSQVMNLFKLSTLDLVGCGVAALEALDIIL